MGNLKCKHACYDEQYLENCIEERVNVRLAEMTAGMTTNISDMIVAKLSATKVSVSTSAIQSYVENLILDEDINIPLLPDCIERKIYTNMITLLLRLIERAVKTTSINILNHQIVMDMNSDQ